MKIVCISPQHNITLHKSYDIIPFTRTTNWSNEFDEEEVDFYWITDDLGYFIRVDPTFFISLEEFRNRQISKII